MASRGSKKVVYAALTGNLLIAIAKLFAAWITGSSAMLSEAVHSVVEHREPGTDAARHAPGSEAANFRTPVWTRATTLLLDLHRGDLNLRVGCRDRTRARNQQDPDPAPVGKPRRELCRSGRKRRFRGLHLVRSPKGVRPGKRASPMAGCRPIQQGPHCVHRAVRGHGCLAGPAVRGSRTSRRAGIQSAGNGRGRLVVIGVLLAVTAGFLAYESQSLLTGEGVQPDVRRSIRQLAETEAGVVRVNELLTMHFGPQDVLVAMSLDFQDAQTAATVENTVSRLERRIKAGHPEVTRVFVEAQSFEASRRSDLSRHH